MTATEMKEPTRMLLDSVITVATAVCVLAFAPPWMLPVVVGYGAWNYFDGKSDAYTGRF